MGEARAEEVGENIYLSLNEGDNDGKGIFGRGKL